MHRLSYSQFGEDITAAKLLRNVETGFYVDIGAHHPLRHSNTALLHIGGWRGVNVEPVRRSIDLFRRYRPQAINVHAAIHNEANSVTLYKFRKGLANTIIERRAEELSANKKSEGQEVVPALSLNDVFERHVPQGVRVNYLTVDVEGYDSEAILAFDLGKHHPDVACIEIQRPDMMALGENSVVRYMFDHGYQLYAINVFSFTFVSVRAAAQHLDMPRVARLREVTRQGGRKSGGP